MDALTGGREGLIEAQRYPDDFDGIIAGAPALNFQVQNGIYHAWQARSNTGPDGKPILVASRLALLHRAVVAQCDALDGQKDGLISDPLACRFDPQVLQCTGSVKADCLSAAEVEAVRRLYDGPRDAKTGERLTLGGPMPGSELNWAGVFVPANPDQPIFSKIIALEALRNLVFEKPPGDNFTLQDMRFDLATFDKLRPRHPLFDATNPDLSEFARKGGKLILWHGWADPHISPLNTITYHDALQLRMGGEHAASFERLYLLPGVSHCGGGEGPSALDLLTPMMQWVEHGVAPATITVKRVAQQTAGEFGQPASGSSSPPPGARPVPPPPAGPDHLKVAPYATPGNSRITLPEWAGADFFNPYRPAAY